jgi:methylglutaconyl-CoA hydratase
MTRATITHEKDARGVAPLVLNRPEKQDVLSGALCVELTTAAGRMGAVDGVRVVVRSGAG